MGLSCYFMLIVPVTEDLGAAVAQVRPGLGKADELPLPLVPALIGEALLHGQRDLDFVEIASGQTMRRELWQSLKLEAAPSFGGSRD